MSEKNGTSLFDYGMEALSNQRLLFHKMDEAQRDYLLALYNSTNGTGVDIALAHKKFQQLKDEFFTAHFKITRTILLFRQALHHLHNK